MRWWHVALAVAVLVAALALLGTPAGPIGKKARNTVPRANVQNTTGPRVVVLAPDGEEINARIWREGAWWCAEAEKYLPDCAVERNGSVTIRLREDPGLKRYGVEVNGCAYLAVAPAGAVPVGPKPCGTLELPGGKYRFVFFDGNGAVIGMKTVFVDRNVELNVNGHPGGTARIRVIDGATGKEINAWVNGGGYAEWGSDLPLGVNACGFVSAWRAGYKMGDAYVCQGDEANIVLQRQVNGGALIVSAPGAEWIEITDRNGNVYALVRGDGAELKDTPVGVYRIYAVNGASVTEKTISFDGSQRIVSVDAGPGTAELVAETPVQVFALGKKVAEGMGRLQVPARTVLHVVVLSRPPREEVLVLLPGEERVI